MPVISKFSKLIELLLQRPLPPLVLLSLIFYFFHTDYLPLTLRSLILLLLAVLNYLSGYLLLHLVRERLARPVSSLWPELLAAVALFLLILLLGWGWGSALIFWMIIAVWLLTQFILKKRGNLYLTLIGLSIFVVVNLSYWLIHQIERGYLYYQYSRFQKEEVIRRPALNIYDNGGRLELVLNREAALHFRLPTQLNFSSEASTDFDYRYAIGGMPLISWQSQSAGSSKQNRDGAAIKIILFQRPESDVLGLNSFRPEFELLLGHRKNRGDISNLNFTGITEQNPPETEIQLRGLFWSYLNRSSRRSETMGYYLLRSPTGEQFLLVITHPEADAKLHPSAVRELLSGIEWRSR